MLVLLSLNHLDLQEILILTLLEEFKNELTKRLYKITCRSLRLCIVKTVIAINSFVGLEAPEEINLFVHPFTYIFIYAIC